MLDLNCFKAYDISGSVPDELNEGAAYRLGRAYADLFSPRIIVVGQMYVWNALVLHQRCKLWTATSVNDCWIKASESPKP